MNHTAKYGGLVRAAVALAALAVALLAACGGDPAPAATQTPAPTQTPPPVALAPTTADAATPPAASFAPPLAPIPPPPTAAPTLAPTPAPTPTPPPSATPPPAPTFAPTPAPTLAPPPTAAPTPAPAPAATFTPTPSPTAAPTFTPTPKAPTSAADFLSRSIRAMGEVESYRYSMKIDVSTVSDDVITNMPVSVEGAYLAPDSYSAVLNLDLGFFGKIKIPVIAIGDAVYIQDPNFGEWDLVGQGEDLSYFDPDFIAFLANPASSVSPDYVGRLKNLRLGASETIGGAETLAVSFILPDGGADDAYPKLGEVDASVRIGVSDSLMRRIDAAGDLARGGDSPEDVIGGYGGLRTEITFRSSATLRDFGAVREAIEPPILSAGIQPPPFVVQSPTPAPIGTPDIQPPPFVALSPMPAPTATP